MNRPTVRNLCLTAACGAVVGLSSMAAATPKVINIAGATLLENYLSKRAATVDFIDADHDFNARAIPGAAEAFPDQLAPFELPSSSGSAAIWGANTIWGVNYMATSSGTGLSELIDQGRAFQTGNATATTMPQSARSSAFFNRYKYIVGGGVNADPGSEFSAFPTGILNTGNGGGSPIRQVISGPNKFNALFTIPNTPSTSPNDGLTDAGGIQVDMAILDVPSRYAVRIAGAAAPSRTPLAAGYGQNPRLSANPNGSNSANAMLLASLSPRTGAPSIGVNANLNDPAVADANTLFDSPLFFAPIAPIANFGTGISTIRMTDMQYLFGSGRTPTGENLVVVTRNATSGTRIGFENSIGQDASFGVGDNLGAQNNALVNDRLGPDYLVNLKNGNPRVEATIYNTRLAIGYGGPERGITNATPDIQWLKDGFADIPSVINDLPNYGGTTPVRPTLAAILSNNTPATAWVIGGPATLVSFGDPKSNAAADGGLGWMEPFRDTGPDGIPGNLDVGENDGVYQVGEPFNDLNGNSVRDAVEARPGTLPPAMANPAAAAFINNITRSIKEFTGCPGCDDTTFTPGEYAATQFILNGALPRVQELTNPTNLIANTGFSAPLKAYLLSSTNVQNDSLFTAFGRGVAPVKPANSRAGKVPSRKRGVATYSDNAINANASVTGAFITEGGAALSGNDGANDTTRDNLPLRNLIAGDFNGDGLRNINDAADLVGAWKKRNGTPGWVAPAGNGALATLANSVGTTVPGSDFSIEIVGDFNGDGSFTSADLRYWADGLAIATSGPHTGKLDRLAGFEAIDSAFGGSGNFFGTINGPGAGIAAHKPGDAAADLVGSAAVGAVGGPTRGSAPRAADGRVDAFDITYVYKQFKQAGIDGNEVDWAAEYDESVLADLSADVNGDLKINQTDVDYIVKTVLCTNYGDVNLDGHVTAADLVGLPAFGTAATWSTGDMDGDGLYTSADQAIIAGNTGKPRPCCPADYDGTGSVDADDLFTFLDLWFAQNGSGPGSADADNSGLIDADDLFTFLDLWFAQNGNACP